MKRARLHIVTGDGQESRPPADIPADAAPRGVYKASVRISGMVAYYAVTSWGQILGPLPVDERFTSDDDIIVALEDALDACDPEGPRLSLVRGDATEDDTAARRALARLVLLPSHPTGGPRRAS